MVQVPSIDADLEVPRARRRVGGLGDGDTVDVVVRGLSLLSLLATVGEYYPHLLLMWEMYFQMSSLRELFLLLLRFEII